MVSVAAEERAGPGARCRISLSVSRRTTASQPADAGVLQPFWNVNGAAQFKAVHSLLAAVMAQARTPEPSTMCQRDTPAGVPAGGVTDVNTLTLLQVRSDCL